MTINQIEIKEIEIPSVNPYLNLEEAMEELNTLRLCDSLDGVDDGLIDQLINSENK